MVSSVVSAVTSVFTAMAGWISSTIPDIVKLFYDATQGDLTFIGVLAVAGLSVSVFFLLMGLVQNFLHFRG